MRKEGGDLELEWRRKGKEKGCSRVWETERKMGERDDRKMGFRALVAIL